MSVSREAKPSKSKFTYEHYVLFPDDGNQHEIIDGDHYMNPAPVPYHQKLSRHIQYQQFSAIEVRGHGDVINAPIDVQFSDYDVVQPDLVVVLKDNRIITTTKLKGAPDLVVEILSPSTSKRDQTLKKELYERNGVPEYWIVDPDEKVVRQYRLTDGAYAEAERCTDEATFFGLPGVTVDLTRVW